MKKVKAVNYDFEKISNPMQLIMLGTGNAKVTECYNTCFVLRDGDQFFMVDGGGGIGILRQLKQANLNWQNMREIFVTHKHIDHLLGIIWMVRMFCQGMTRGEYAGDVNVYSHGEVIELIRSMTQALLSEKESKWLDCRVHLITVSDGESRTICGHNVRFFDIHSTKAKQFGFSMDLDAGKKLTCCGDEPYNPSEEAYVKGSTWLLHEAFCLHAQADLFKPYEKYHSTVKDACELAQSLSIENLVLYHTEDRNILSRKELYTQEGRKYYSGNLLVPDDLEIINLL